MALMKNFLFLELTSLGLAYSLIQKHTNMSDIKVFESSPTPRGAVLILTSPVYSHLESVWLELKSNESELAQVENFCLSQDLPEKVIAAYLNQTLNPLEGHLVLIESNSICESIKSIWLAVQNEIEICEFRTLRSSVYRCMVSLSTKSTRTEIEKLFGPLSATKKITVFYISTPTDELKNQFTL
jgi:hypothetical protein